MQPPYCRVADKWWDARTTPHSSTEEGDGDKDEDKAEGGDEDNDVDKDEHEGGGEVAEDEDDGDDQVENSAPLAVHRNLARICQQPLHGTYSAQRHWWLIAM